MSTAAQKGEESRTWDVIVVGAGLSGLSAARELTRAGKTCAILEARDRVGGKTYSASPAFKKVLVDLGAAWINDSNQSHMIELAREVGAELITQNTSGNVALEDADGTRRIFAYGDIPPFDDESRRQVLLIRDQTEADCQSLPATSAGILSARQQGWDLMTFADYCGGHTSNEAALRTANLWVRAMLGHEASDVSALFFLRYCRGGGGLLRMRSDGEHGGQYLRIRRGTQSVANGLAGLLPASLASIVRDCPVTAVRRQASSLYKVEAASVGRVFWGREVVMAVPAPCVRSIAFEPSVPQTTAAVQNSFRYGYYTKVMMLFRSPFWTELGFCGLVQSFVGPASVMRDTSIPQDDAWVLTCFLCGDPGRVWSRLGKDGEREEALLDQIGRVFGSHELARDRFIGSIGYEWIQDEFSGRGCPCAALPPGVMAGSGAALEAPSGGIHFAGTETADVWKGYMEGAVVSGIRAAGEILQNMATGSKL